MLNKSDLFIAMLDKSLRVVAGVASESRPSPAKKITQVDSVNEKDRRHSAALMRVNHVGEVCAQALYQSQGLFSQSKELQHQFEQAGKEEEDHLAWTAKRISELGSHVSILNPFWYASAFALGVIAAKVGDATSMGFVVETERQVEAHLNSHLTSLSVSDVKSRAIVEQMRNDEIEHGKSVQALGAVELPWPVKKVMEKMAKVMTTVAYYI